MYKDINLFKSKEGLFFKVVSKKEDLIGLDCDGILIDGDELNCRRIIESSKTKNENLKIAVLGRDDSFNRRALETLKINYLISPELTDEKDNLKQRASGMNHITAKIAKLKNIIIVTNIEFLFEKENKKSKAKRVSKIIQNIKICRKENCAIRFATLAQVEKNLLSEKEIQSIGYSLGMSSQEVKECFKF